MRLKVISAPAAKPVLLATVKAHCEIASDDTTFDAELNRLIAEKTTEIENYIGRALITRTYKGFLDSWELDQDGALILPMPPVQTDGFAIQYYDEDDVLQTWSSSEYQLDVESEPARLVAKSGYSFPSLSSRLNAVEITMKCGYGAAESSVPEPIVGAICVKIATRFALREDSVIGSIISDFDSSGAADQLLADYRTRFLG